MTEELINQILQEAETFFKDTVSVLDPNFPHQTNFIKHSSRKKALWCTRRAAKSYTAGLYMVQTALNYSKVNILYLGLSRLVAKGIIWKDILKVINETHKLEVTQHLTELTLTYPNGSMIYVTGVDASEEEMKKLLGKKWHLVVIDEAQSYSIDLRALVYGVLGPTLIDTGGTICMLGTAGNRTNGLFFDITTGKEPGWDIFTWTALDNPYVKKQWQDELNDIATNRPLFKETALFKQWYLNEWVIDEDAKIYKFSEGKNIVLRTDIPTEHVHYVLGVDLAHSPDSTAFCIGAYRDGEPVLYVVYAKKYLKMDITDVALHIHSLERTYKFDVKVADGANKQALAELNNRHKTNLIPADKKDKVDFIKLMNDDFVQGRIKLLKDETKDLQTEYNNLIWLVDANGAVIEPRKEDPTIHNDLADSNLYLWRHCYTYIDLFKSEKKWVNPHDQRQWEPEHLGKLQEREREKKNPNHLEIAWDEEWNEGEDGDDWGNATGI